MNLTQFLKKQGLSQGDFVKVDSSKGKLEGFIIPSTDSNILALKLNSGYNTGILIKNIKAIEKTGESREVSKGKKLSFEAKENLPTVSILNVGGTITSRINYKYGGVITDFNTEDLLSMYPELTKLANIKGVMVSQIMSEDILMPHYKKMCTAIEEEVKKGIKGIIVTHGTDNLGVTAAALSFALHDINVPVLLVGSQRSPDRGSSDAAMNLLCAAKFITETDFVGVASCMHASTSDDNCLIIEGTRVRKMHTSRRDAFKSINDIPVASVDYRTGNINYFKKDYSKKNNSRKLEVKSNFDLKVGLLKTHINMVPEQFLLFKKLKYRGLVIEGTGLGHMPATSKENEKNLKAIKELIKAGLIVASTSATIFGRVHPDVYVNLRKLSNEGVIFAEDMFAETAHIKLSWLLANYKKEEAEKLFTQNLRGEISAFTSIKAPFIEDFK